MNFSPFYLRNEIRYRQNSLEFIATSLFHKHIVQINKIPPHSFEVSSSIVSFRFFTLKFSKLIETRCIDSWYKVLYFSGKEKTHINDIYISRSKHDTFISIIVNSSYFSFRVLKCVLDSRARSRNDRFALNIGEKKLGRLTIPLCSYTGITCDITSMSFPFAKTSLPFASVSGIPAEYPGSVTRIQVPAGGGEEVGERRKATRRKTMDQGVVAAAWLRFHLCRNGGNVDK